MDKQSSFVMGKTIKQVRKLNLSGQGLTEIPASVFEHTNLTKLVLSRNAIKRIPKEIAKLKKLEVLDLRYNKIDVLPAPVFNLPKLRVLSVGHNFLKKFPNQLKDSSVKILIADHNQLEKINSEALNNIEVLIISNNPISGPIVKNFLPALRLYDFRNTGIESPAAEMLSADCKGWGSKKTKINIVNSSCSTMNIESAEIDSGSKIPPNLTQHIGDGSIFISHSSKDKELIDKFVDHILQLGIGLPDEKIRCTSINGLGIPNGEEMRAWISSKIKNCSLAFLILSPNYKRSEICLNEMGAIWALDIPVILLLWPGLDYKDIGWLEEIRQAGHINDDSELDKLFDELTDKFGLEKKVAKWGSQKKKFLDFCKNLPYGDN